MELNKSDEQPTKDKNTPDVTAGNFVAAEYENQWYAGKVSNVDDDEAEIDFMERADKWPTVKDEIWVPLGNVMLVIEEPIRSGKTKRLYKIEQKMCSK